MVSIFTGRVIYEVKDANMRAITGTWVLRWTTEDPDPKSDTQAIWGM
jgi:hypothetical protein